MFALQFDGVRVSQNLKLVWLNISMITYVLKLCRGGRQSRKRRNEKILKMSLYITMTRKQ